MLPTVTLAVPTDDLTAAAAFYRDGLGLPLADDPGDGTLPEPVEFNLAAGSKLMLVPRDGFGWVIGDHAVAEPGDSEVVLGVTFATTEEIDAFVARGIAAGGREVAAPEEQPWGYSGAFADLDGHVWMAQTAPVPSEG